ncbi:DNA-processing protein DprA [Klenkia sp. PcliD-1-E]|uniref:DNA-processing protein DprA n=1 Tax=Klenkia sp. PcliD-1-E TaxID=2954492 RepID=UPI0020970994|nr:DNA-processing protein DprA [Klenkia sp. PcliD-1-E]MCO7219486.1 DNA-protecting protein DprA [Klenkia sp. PcliD-1-E]
MSEHRRFIAPAPADPGTTLPELEQLREARAWLIAAQMGVVSHVLVDHLADVGPLAAQRELMAGQAPHEVAALMHGQADAGQPLMAGERTGARLVIPEDEEWPAALRSTGLLAPLGLWVRGPARLDDVLQRAVTVIGARASTAYGEHVAGDLGAGLTDRGWTVVSGGGLGIDAAAHRGALTGSPGTTVMVARGGLDRPYPHSNADLFGHIVDRGGLLVSEFGPGAAPTAWRSLRGSQLLAMLSAAVVVVEALVRSGTRPTVTAALEIPRPVFAVPGPVTSAFSVGCHQLISSGEARLVTGSADLLANLDDQLE